MINLKNRWVRSRNCVWLVTWFCYQLIAKPGNKTDTVSWPDPDVVSTHKCGWVTQNENQTIMLLIFTFSLRYSLWHQKVPQLHLWNITVQCTWRYLMDEINWIHINVWGKDICGHMVWNNNVERQVNIIMAVQFSQNMEGGSVFTP